MTGVERVVIETTEGRDEEEATEKVTAVGLEADTAVVDTDLGQ